MGAELGDRKNLWDGRAAKGFATRYLAFFVPVTALLVFLTLAGLVRIDTP